MPCAAVLQPGVYAIGRHDREALVLSDLGLILKETPALTNYMRWTAESRTALISEEWNLHLGQGAWYGNGSTSHRKLCMYISTGSTELHGVEGVFGLNKRTGLNTNDYLGNNTTSHPNFLILGDSYFCTWSRCLCPLAGLGSLDCPCIRTCRLDGLYSTVCADY